MIDAGQQGLNKWIGGVFPNCLRDGVLLDLTVVHNQHMGPQL